MKQLIFKIFIFSILFFCFIVSVQKFTDKMLKTYRMQDFGIMNDIFDNKINEEIRIYGTSRAMFHFNTKILEESLKKNIYSFGMNGYNFDMIMLRDTLLSKYCDKKPSTIIFSLDITTLSKREDLYESAQFIPYLSNDIVAEKTKHYKGFEKFNYYFPASKYYGQYKLVLHAFQILLFPKLNVYDCYKGYKGNDFTWGRRRNPENKPTNIKLDKESLNNFQFYISRLIAKHIKLILVYSPEYIPLVKRHISNRDQIIDIYSQISRKYSIPFYNFTSDPMCYDMSLFYEESHLNTKGANLFSEKLGHLLQ